MRAADCGQETIDWSALLCRLHQSLKIVGTGRIAEAEGRCRAQPAGDQAVRGWINIGHG